MQFPFIVMKQEAPSNGQNNGGNQQVESFLDQNNLQFLNQANESLSVFDNNRMASPMKQEHQSCISVNFIVLNIIN